MHDPNGASVPPYYSVNLGAAQNFKLPHNQTLMARLDVVNLTDNIYQLRKSAPALASMPRNMASASAFSAR